MRIIDKVAWLRIEDGRILSTRSHGKDVFYFPGGKREPGESDLDTLTREIAEELTVTVDPRPRSRPVCSRPGRTATRRTCWSG